MDQARCFAHHLRCRFADAACLIRHAKLPNICDSKTTATAMNHVRFQPIDVNENDCWIQIGNSMNNR